MTVYTIQQPGELSEDAVSTLLRMAGEEHLSFLQARTSFADYTRKLQSLATSIIAHREAESVGYLAIYLNQPEKEAAYITHLGVNAAFRNAGLGKGLVHEACSLAQTNGFRKVCLEVADFNQTALSLYLRLGFRPYASSVDSSLLALSLS